MANTIDTLFVIGHGHDNVEKATVPFVLANVEVQRPGKRVEVILIFDAAPLAVKGDAEGFQCGPPFESFDLAERMKSFQDAGGIINVCAPCLIHRELNDAPLTDGVVKINGPVFMEMKDRADKILSFA